VYVTLSRLVIFLTVSLIQHSDRFLTGAYSVLVKSGDIVDYALLDFRHTIPSAATPG
jgi:hypothetical protein